MLIQHKAYGGYMITTKIPKITEQATEEAMRESHNKASQRASNGAHIDGAEYTYKDTKDTDTAQSLWRPHA